MDSPCDVRNAYPSYKSGGLNLTPRFADHASSCLPTSSNVPFPVGDVTCTFFSAKYVRSNLSPKTCNHYMLCRLCNYCSTSGAIRLAFDLLPLASSLMTCFCKLRCRCKRCLWFALMTCFCKLRCRCNFFAVYVNDLLLQAPMSL